MDAARWAQVRQLLDQALDRDGTEREAFVVAIEDPALRADVGRLLARQAEGRSLDQPAAALAASALAAGTAVRDWDREQIGRRIGPFVLDELLGSGGMGTVYRAHRADGRFEQTVAIKLVLTAHPGLRERFRNEQEILAGLHHPNIAQLIDGGEADDGIPYLAMEYVAGVPITDYCRDRLPDVAGRVRLLLRVADALSHAHRNLVIHRDIKPSNLLVSDDGHPKLLDFGIAKLVGAERFRPITQQRIGPMTPAYAAPEQFRGGPISVATDVYQFGALLYRLITGRLPYDGDADDPVAWGQAVIDREPITLGRALAAARRGGAERARDAVRTLNRDINRDLDAIVGTALAKDPARRYSSMDAFAADLEAFLDGRPVQARRGGSLYHAARFVRRHRVPVAIAVGAALGLVGLSGYALRQAETARREAERARVAVEFINEVFRAADPANGRGVRLSAEDMIGAAAERLEPQLQRHPDLRGPLYGLIAEAYLNLGAVDRAHRLYERALADMRAATTPAPLVLAAALERAAWAAQRNGALDRARAWASEAEALAQGDSVEALRIRQGLYNTRWAMLRDGGEASPALALAQQAVREAETASAEARDAMRCNALYRLGVSLTDLGRYDQAEAPLRESLRLARRMWGEDHYRTLRARQSLGWYFTARGDPERGLAELEPVGERIRDLFGEHSQDWGTNLYNRANAYRALDQGRRAAEAYRAAATAYAASAAPNAAQIGWALWNAGLVLAERGEHDAAREMLDQAERAWQGSIADDAPARAQLWADAARNRLALGDLAAAERYVDRALSLRRRLEGESAAVADLLALSGDIAAARDDRIRAALVLDDAASVLERAAPARAREALAWRERARRLRDAAVR